LTLTRADPAAWPPLAVIHINHQLNPRAQLWASHVEALCAAWSIPCTIKNVEVSDIALYGVEAAARLQRYDAFAETVGAHELLLQAHHRDDQIETLLLRLLRGSGLAGLRSIPVSRPLGQAWLLRPWLDRSRAEIIDYAQAQGLQWIEDDSNADARYDRNFLRQRVLPLLAERWPAYRDTLSRVVTQSGEAEALVQEIAAMDWQALDDGGEGLAIAGLQALSPLRQRQVLRFWLRRQQLPTPSRAQLESVVGILAAAVDAEPCVGWPGVEVRRFHSRLYAMAPLPPIATDFDLPWSPPLTTLHLPAGYGSLQAVAAVGAGLRTDRRYHVRNRRGGERCHPAAREHSQSLKKLLQEAGLAPWWRERVPLIYCDDELAAVGDLWICRGFAAAPQTPGWQPRWQRPPVA
ncbi:MAG: tRNA lysidine(34) synthetase TilS, partial [Spongiibacteraceae bacterium]